MTHQTLLVACVLFFNACTESFTSIARNSLATHTIEWKLKFQETLQGDDSPAPEQLATPEQIATSIPPSLRMAPLLVNSPAEVEFVESRSVQVDSVESLENMMQSSTNYPFAMMLSGSAPYIAAHAGETIVFHMPGDYLETESCNALLSDVALARVLGMKIVIVIGCRYDLDTCDLDFAQNSHECHNSLKVTDAATLRLLEEEVGYMRTELERKLNRYMRMHGSGTITDGNVISGNFYTARQFGRIQEKDFEYTGYAPVNQVHAANIEHHLSNDDVVLLTTVGLSNLGDLVNVNGYHLTASVAASLNAYKIVYLANEGSILRAKQGGPVLEIPLTFAKDLVEYHDVKVHKSGHATFAHAAASLDSHAVELLLHLGWATSALESGVTRAHIVNPGDGAILEELFTSKNGMNICLYHDVEEEDLQQNLDPLEEDFREFFGKLSS